MRRSTRVRIGLAGLGAFAAAAGLAVPSAVAQGPVGVPGPPVVPPSTAAPTAIGTLAAATPVLGFHGAVPAPTPLPVVNDPVPVVCAPQNQCREFRFVARTASPFLVSIKGTVAGPNGTFNADDGFDLYLYDPAGHLAGTSNSIGADGQAVSLDAPRPGRYTVVVTVTYAEDANAGYDGEVRLMDTPSWLPPAATCGTVGDLPVGCYELPVLSAVPAYDLAVTGLPPAPSTPLGFPFPVALSTPTSCYADESIGVESPSVAGLQNPALRCLRFTSDVRDTGAGPLEVRMPWVATGNGTPQSGFVPGGCHAQQVVTTATGDDVVRPAGDCEFHPAHGHFHYRDLVSFSLYQPAAAGGLGPKVGSALKESFCLGDDDFFGFATPGPNGPRSFAGQPGCNVPSQEQTGPGGAGAWIVEGISPGWGDVYTWDTPDQYIDVTHVAPGTYDLVEETNPDGVLLVAGPTRTCALTQVVLTATSVTEGATQASVPCPT